MSSLEVRGLTVRFGGVTAVDDVTLSFGAGVTGVIGPNGAGKSTLFNAVTGLVGVTAGSVRVDGREMRRLKPDQIARLGVRRTFQNIRLFGRQTALDNVAIGALQGMRGFSKAAAARQRARQVIDELGLSDVAGALPGSLPYATQRKLEIARCLAGEPRLLLLDEPAAGMHVEDRDELCELITGLGSRLSVVLVEHDMALISRVCSDVVVMDSGSVLVRGDARAVVEDPRVVNAYLGGAA